MARWVANPPAWLKVQAASPEALREINEDLDGGEREAIALAADVQADLILMDDMAARTEARLRNLRVAGTLGILRVAAELSLVDARLAVSKLEGTNFYFDPILVREVLGRWLDSA